MENSLFKYTYIDEDDSTEKTGVLDFTKFFDEEGNEFHVCLGSYTVEGKQNIIFNNGKLNKIEKVEDSIHIEPLSVIILKKGV